MKSYTIHILISLLFSTFAFAGESADRFKVVGGRLVEAINAQDHGRIRKDFDQTMLEALPEDQSKAFFKGMMNQYGKITALAEPRITSDVQAVFVATCQRGVLDMTLTLNDEDQIIGLLFLPHKPEIPVPERNSVQMRLPFHEAWTVVWGGDTQALNYHHDTPNQRYAFDFIITDAAGKSYQGSGRRNEDYYAFGKEVIAPADGVVTEVIDGVRDNMPGSMNPYSAVGNAVFIKHAAHEVSMLGHFKQDSIRVKPGDTVKAGQVLGLCGNSGNSSEAHIHYHLQNTEIIQDGTGVKCYFENVRIIKPDKKQPKEAYSPLKGEVVENVKD